MERGDETEIGGKEDSDLHNKGLGLGGSWKWEDGSGGRQTGGSLRKGPRAGSRPHKHLGLLGQSLKKKKKLDSTVYCDCVGIKMDIYNKRHSVNIEII